MNKERSRTLATKFPVEKAEILHRWRDLVFARYGHGGVSVRLIELVETDLVYLREEQKRQVRDGYISS